MSFVPIADALAVPRQARQRSGMGKRHQLVIYALVDPLDDCIRYVGVTSRVLTARLKLHLQKPTNARMGAWFASLREVRMSPRIVKLEWVSGNEWEDAERGWIHWCRQRGELLNVDRGGMARRASGEVRLFVAGEYQEPSRISQDGPKGSRGGAVGRGSRPKCRPRRGPVGLVHVTAGVFRRAR